MNTLSYNDFDSDTENTTPICDASATDLAEELMRRFTHCVIIHENLKDEDVLDVHVNGETDDKKLNELFVEGYRSIREVRRRDDYQGSL
ncbi:MAG: hypothetical protein H6815_00405 [Phycisphaeraceae bacterium]|nr:hypothetical protein [Phycisphaerales bacterium]MCB9858885.1 hypothetical protein [Phycisphaeraceae bacterium]